MGEFEMLARLRARLPPPSGRLIAGSGDDAAVSVPAAATATSVDAIVEGVHFRRDDAPLAVIGRKAMAAALSDLAAMAAEPGEAYAVLGVPDDLDEDGCMAVLDGLLETASEHGVLLAGGDVTRSPVLILAITVVGHAPSAERFVLRSGARPPDRLVLTGEIGGAAAGRLLLDRPALGERLDRAAAEELRRRQLDPAPRLAAGKALAVAGARAMIDVSDGLGADAAQLSAASGVGLRIEVERLPIGAGVEAVAVAAGLEPARLAVSGGEDYELLATLPGDRVDEAAAAVARTGVRLTRIGEVFEGEGVEISSADGRRLPPDGHDHLRNG